MQIPTKKLKNGFEMSVYGIGTWKIGGKMSRDPHNDDEADIHAIQSAIDLGVTHIDTAESYADGYAEILVGKAIKKFDRSKLFITSKVFANHLGYDDLIQAAKASMKRLGISYLDLYLAHRYSLSIPVKETMRAMDFLIEQGLIKHFGVSNFNVEEMKETQSYTKNKIVCNQIHLNVQYRESEKRGVLKYCQENDMMFVAYRPLQKGMILDNPLLIDLAKKYRKTPSQIAINWLISQKNVVTIAKTTNIKHLKENLGAIGWEMEKDDIEKVRNDFPNQEFISEVVPLH